MQCTKCSYQKDIYVGGGLQDCEVQTILSTLPADMQCILSKAIDEGAIQISVTRKICSCDFCGELYALPIVSYLFNGIEHKLYASCPHCSRAGTDKRKENTIFVCPECGEIVEQQYAGHWD